MTTKTQYQQDNLKVKQEEPSIEEVLIKSQSPSIQNIPTPSPRIKQQDSIKQQDYTSPPHNDPPHTAHRHLNSAVFMDETKMQHSKTNPRMLHSNATSHVWAFGALAELVDNAQDQEAQAKNIQIGGKYTSSQKTDGVITVQDDGLGMNTDQLHRMLSFGFSKKEHEKGNVGKFGIGFKSGSMRIGQDVVIITKQQATRTASAALLSQTFLKAIEADDILIPMFTWSFEEDPSPASNLAQKYQRQFPSDEQWQEQMAFFLQFSSIQNEEQILQEFEGLGVSGTKIMISNLSKPIEFNITEDDIKLRTELQQDNGDVINRDIGAQVREGGMDTQMLEEDYSLKCYLSILYLKPQVTIILQGQKVKYSDPIGYLNLQRKHYGPYQPREIEVNQRSTKRMELWLGYNSQNNKAYGGQKKYGVHVYNNNRLIKSWQKFFWQKQGNCVMKELIGVCSCDFITPTHNKQAFNTSDIYYQKFNSKIRDYMKHYYFSFQTVKTAGVTSQQQMRRKQAEEEKAGGPGGTGGTGLKPPAKRERPIKKEAVSEDEEMSDSISESESEIDDDSLEEHVGEMNRRKPPTRMLQSEDGQKRQKVAAAQLMTARARYELDNRGVQRMYYCNALYNFLERLKKDEISHQEHYADQSWKYNAQEITTKIRRNKYSYYFRRPVNDKWPGCEMYYKIIKYPMDFGTIYKKIKQDDLYSSLSRFIQDCFQVFLNCFEYNVEDSEVFEYGVELLVYFHHYIRELLGPNLPDHVQIQEDFNPQTADREKLLEQNLAQLHHYSKTLEQEDVLGGSNNWVGQLESKYGVVEGVDKELQQQNRGDLVNSRVVTKQKVQRYRKGSDVSDDVSKDDVSYSGFSSQQQYSGKNKQQLTVYKDPTDTLKTIQVQQISDVGLRTFGGDKELAVVLNEKDLQIIEMQNEVMEQRKELERLNGLLNLKDGEILRMKLKLKDYESLQQDATSSIEMLYQQNQKFEEDRRKVQASLDFYKQKCQAQEKENERLKRSTMLQMNTDNDRSFQNIMESGLLFEENPTW